MLSSQSLISEMHCKFLTTVDCRHKRATALHDTKSWLNSRYAKVVPIPKRQPLKPMASSGSHVHNCKVVTIGEALYGIETIIYFILHKVFNTMLKSIRMPELCRLFGRPVRKRQGRSNLVDSLPWWSPSQCSDRNF